MDSELRKRSVVAKKPEPKPGVKLNAAATSAGKKKNPTPTFTDELHKWWWIYDDCCGNFCAMFTLFLHFLAYWIQMKFVLVPWIGKLLSWQALIYTFVTGMAVWSHFRAQFTNPGTIPRFTTAPKCADPRYGSRYTCRVTGVIKPPTAHYCREASQVVLRMDHYCPWVNNVVGIFTQKYFLLFIFYTCLCTLFCAIALTSRFLSCRNKYMHVFSEDGKTHHLAIKAWCHRVDMLDVLACVINFIEAIIFSIFTICMGWDQFEAITENTPYIDRLQGKKGKEQAAYTSLCDVFGGPFSWRWFVPLKPEEKLRERFSKMCEDTYHHLKAKEAPEPQAEQRREQYQYPPANSYPPEYHADFSW